jgi:hypothetical protein
MFAMFVQIIQGRIGDAAAARLLDEEMSRLDDVRFLDLHQPWFASRR